MNEPRESDPRFTLVADNQYQCRKCNRVFGTKQAVWAHFGVQHGTVPRAKTPVTKREGKVK